MPSMVPLLSYSVVSQDDDDESISTGRTSLRIAQDSPKSSGRIPDRNEIKRRGKIAVSGRNSESSPKEGKKMGKKKRRPAGKLASRRDVSSNDGNSGKVEELVLKATAHAQAVQAVKKAVLEIQLFLLDGVKDKAQLHGASPLLTQNEYSDVVTERSIARQCGYPLCQKGLIAETRKGRYRISLREHKVYDLSETGLFCCANCLVASKTFQSSLQIQRDDIMGKDKLVSIMHDVFNPKASKLNQSDRNSKDQSGLSNESIVSGIQEREDTGITSFDDAGTFDAVEGYVPKNSARHRQAIKITEQSVIPNSDQVECGTNLERLASTNERELTTHPISNELSSDKGKSLLILDELKVETAPVPLLKSALKKGKTESVLKRNVSWGDQRKKDLKPERKDQRSSPRLKERLKAHNHITHTVACATSADRPNSQETSVATGSSIDSSSVPVTRSAGPVECKSNIGLPVNNLETEEKSDRVLAAETVATALVEAAEAAAGGEMESVEAVARAGLSIVLVSESVKELVPVNHPTEDSLIDLNKEPLSSTASSAEVDVRWPQLEAQEEDDLDVPTGRGGWHDAPPGNFKVEVSMFGIIWMALEEWISAATIAHIYGKEPQDQEEYVVANGREFRRQVDAEDSTSAEILKTFSTCLSQAFPDVVQALRLNVPVSTLEKNIGQLIRTMTFIEALPSFGRKHWSMILMLFIDGLSVHQLPTIGVHLSNNISLLRKFLESTGTSEAEYDTFRGLLLPLGRLPTMSTMSGG